jgi:hypothetical protein
VTRVIAAVAAALVVVASLAVVRTSAATGPALIRITSTEVRSAFVDVGPRGRSVGDMDLYSGTLFNRRITGRSLGSTELICTNTFSGVRSCRATYSLPKGKLVVGGTVRFREIYQLAILGGTGLYDNARGSLTVTRIARSPRRELVVFRLAG